MAGNTIGSDGSTLSLASLPVVIVHGNSPWTWEISNTSAAVHWNPVPDAIRYQFSLSDSTGRVLMESVVSTGTAANLPANLFTPTTFPTLGVPIIEQATQPAPQPPTLYSGSQNSLNISPDNYYLHEGRGGKIYQAENGSSLDLEYVARFQIRVTNVQTGQVRLYDESQVSQLLALLNQDEWQPYRDFYIPVFQPTISLTDNLGLSNGVYRLEARVKYFPVMLPTSSTSDQKLLLKDPGVEPDRINVAATPWSAWSTALDHTVMSVGQNVLPLQTAAGTIAPRPTFAWSSNTSAAHYELWVENRTTKQRVISVFVSNDRQFQTTADLPPGQYDWWVRIIGTTGPRNGWSSKQLLEIYAPSISTSVIAETVDATPVVSWTAATNAQSYVVTVMSATTGMVVYHASELGSRTSHRVATILPNDSYTVSIQAIFANGSRTAPGTAKPDGSFLLSRLTVGVAPQVSAASRPVVTWTAVDGATKYEFWINHIDAAGRIEHLLTADVFGISFRIPQTIMGRSGQFRIWVRAVRSEAGHTSLGRWSNPASINAVTTASSEFGNSADLLKVMSELATSGLGS